MRLEIGWGAEDDDPRTVLRVEADELQAPFLSLASRDELNRSGSYMVRHRGPVHRPASVAPIADYRGMRRWNAPVATHLAQAGVGPADRVVAVPFSDLTANLLRPSWTRDASPRLFRFADEPLGERPYFALLCRLVDGRARLELGWVQLESDGGVREAETGRDLVAQGLRWLGCSAPLLVAGRPVPVNLVARHEYDLRHLFPPEVAQSLLALWPDRPAYLARLEQAAREEHLQPAWYHSALGLDSRGALVVVQRRGTLVEIANALADLGAVDALLLDSGGSCGVWTSLTDAWTSHGWYFRPERGAMLVLRLAGERRRPVADPVGSDRFDDAGAGGGW